MALICLKPLNEFNVAQDDAPLIYAMTKSSYALDCLDDGVMIESTVTKGVRDTYNEALSGSGLWCEFVSIRNRGGQEEQSPIYVVLRNESIEIMTNAYETLVDL